MGTVAWILGTRPRTASPPGFKGNRNLAIRSPLSTLCSIKLDLQAIGTKCANRENSLLFLRFPLATILNDNSGSHYRHTKIIATLGPTTLSVASLASLISEGVDVFRLSIANQNVTRSAEIIDRIRRASDMVGRQVAVMCDVRGPLIDLAELPEIDFVSLSFAGSAIEVRRLRSFLDDLGLAAQIVVNIEDQTGVRNLTDIIREADAVIVGRAQNGCEIDIREHRLVQSKIIRACQAEGKPVIVATRVNESTNESPTLTRAELAELSTAVGEQVDAVMLSSDMTNGACGLETVQKLKKLFRRVEPTASRALNSRVIPNQPTAKMLRSAAVLAQDLGQSGIVVFTRSGLLPYTLAGLRPRGVPIYAFTDVEVTFRQLLLPWGVEPFLMEFSEDSEQRIIDAVAYLYRRQWVSPETCLVVITSATARGQEIDAVQVRQVQSCQEQLVS